MSDIPQDLSNMMGPDEQVQLFIAQKIYHPKINIDSVAITNLRIILRHPHAMGLRKDYTDFNYQDISNVILKKGVLRSTVECALRFGGDPLTLDDLPNDDAQKAYGLIRENLVRFQAPFTAAYSGVPPMRVQPQMPVQPMAAVTCRNCGAQVQPGQRFCGNCGSAV
jgi:hypothetical protein